jgi:T5SS/PEP-CTERM-associated repeat protein
VEVSGAGSELQIAGTLNVGTALGTGELTIGAGAAVHAGVVNLQGQVALDGGLLDPSVLLINQGVTGFGTIEAGDMIDEAVVQANAAPTGEPEVLRGTVLGGGTLDCNGSVTTNAPGELQINTGGTLELAGAVLNAATTSFADDLSPEGHYSLYHSTVDVRFEGASGELLLDDIAGFAGTIASMHYGDEFVIAGGTLSGLNVSNGNTLTILDTGEGAGPGGTDQIVFATAVTSAGFNIVNGDTVQMACFAAGTLIETSHGPTAVQNLGVGDAVQTLLGGNRQIVWVGSRVVDCRRHSQPETVWPVRIARGAVAENIPLRDLFISPDHAIYIEDVLIPVKLLVNCSTIRQKKLDRIVYHHVELEQHDVILAEGLAAETYLDVGDRHLFSGDPVTAPYPQFPARLWEMAGCAPLVLTGERLRAARFALAERTRFLSDTLDPKLRRSAPLAGNAPVGNSTATETHRFISDHMTDVPSLF